MIRCILWVLRIDLVILRIVAVHDWFERYVTISHESLIHQHPVVEQSILTSTRTHRTSAFAQF
ncbi:hypothetical protein M758_7G052000 [Ceratodon purpureus]|nr:hypothetical protein M758_7G052000 [Ceratodon purpureus]